MKQLKIVLLATAMLFALNPAAQAACPADGATPFLAGPINPTDPTDANYNGFASYVQDTQGLALALCLNAQMCFFDPPIPNNAFSVKIGFGAEAFWWLSEANLTTVTGLDALVVMAAEAAFITEEPGDGEQFPFTRLRLRADVPFPGIYTVTHPYGRETFVITAIGTGQEIRESFDLEFMPNAVNRGRVGPWLTWDTFSNQVGVPGDPLLDTQGNDGLSDFVGDAATPHRVKGSPCGNDFFRVSAVQLDGVTPLNIDPDDEDGDGSISSKTTDLFVTSGRVFPGNVATPLVVDAATYSRAADGRVNVFATAPTTAEVTFSGGAVQPADVEQPTAGDGAGRFFGTAALGTVPGTVNVTATNVAQANNFQITRTVAVHDVVSIFQADYDLDARTLTVVATSSDQASPPTLTVLGFGPLNCADPAQCTLTAENLDVAPAKVTVQSVAGGSAEKAVRVIQ